MLSNHFHFLLFCSAVFCLVLAGCSGEPKPDGLPKLYPVSLSFTQEGEPVKDASVRLVAVSESQTNWSVGGSTNATGTAALKTYGKYPGVPEGKYKIVISKYEREQIGNAASMYDAHGENTYDLIDPSFSSPQTTSLTVDVEPGKKSYDPIDLGKKIRQPIKKPGE